MKIILPLLIALLASILNLSLVTAIFAQDPALPSGLTRQSSLGEILDWLDKTTLKEARVGLESNAPGVEPDEVPTTATKYYELSFFSKGFQLTTSDDCNVKLRNDDLRLLSFWTKYPNPAEGSLSEFRKNLNGQSRVTGDMYIPLEILKAKKLPFQHKKRSDKATLLGAWRTEFKFTSDKENRCLFLFNCIPSKEQIAKSTKNGMRIEVVNAGKNGQNDQMYGDTLIFTFDDKRTIEDFHSAFSRAADLCRER